jgi:hypothetical protein
MCGMSPYPHTIENGAGERLTFIRRVGDRLDVVNVVTAGSRPPSAMSFSPRGGRTG